MNHNRNNVIPLRPGGSTPVNEHPQEKSVKARRTTPGRGRTTAIKAAAFAGLGLFGVLRYVLFFLLTALRGPVRFLCALFTFCAIVGLPVAFFGLSDGDPMRGTALAIFGFGLIAASALSWWYDSLLLKLSPERMFMSL